MIPILQAAKKAEIHSRLSDLEAHNPVEAPADNLNLVQGDWKLLYSTISITVWEDGVLCQDDSPLVLV
jgi:hypothetical protein